MTKKTHPMKIVTCCYCGARSTLATRPGERLLCHGCGAAITKLEAFQPDIERHKKSRKDGRKPAIPHHAERENGHLPKDRPARRKKGKRKQRSVWHFVGEAFDDIDDIFDIFD